MYILLPERKLTVSSPTATKLACPGTCQVFQLLPRLTLTAPPPRLVTLNPVSRSNRKIETFEIELLTVDALISLTVKVPPVPPPIVTPPGVTPSLSIS